MTENLLDEWLQDCPTCKGTGKIVEKLNYGIFKRDMRDTESKCEDCVCGKILSRKGSIIACLIRR